MTMLELVKAYLQIGLAVTLVEMLFFFSWGSVTEEAEKHLGHLGLPAPMLSFFLVVGVVYAAVMTVLTWPKVVYDRLNELGDKA